MMYGSTVLLIARDPAVAELIEGESDSFEGMSTQWAEEGDEVCSQPLEEDISLIVVQLDDTMDVDGVARLLWLASTARPPIPVIVLSEIYDVDEALMLFRLGVTDYLSLSDHRDSVPRLVSAVARRSPLGIAFSVEEIVAPSPSRPRMVSHAW